MDEPAEDAEEDTDASDVGDYEHYCVAVAFEFVHWLLGLVSDKVTTAFPIYDRSCHFFVKLFLGDYTRCGINSYFSP